MFKPPKIPRTMSDAELFGLTLLLGLLAAPMIAVLSFLVAPPLLGGGL